MSGNGLPWFKFSPRDWKSDPALCSVSFAARGVLMDLICTMWETDQVGVLVTGSRVWTVQDAAKTLCGDRDVAVEAIAELIDHGVLKRRESDGALYSARMVRDHELRTKRQAAGRLGGASAQLSKQSSKIQANNKQVSISNSDILDLVKNALQGADDPAEVIFDHYPRRQAKARALKAIDVALGEVAPETLLARVLEYAKATETMDRRFVPYPDRWFNEKRWLDELPPDPQTTGQAETPDWRLPPAALVED